MNSPRPKALACPRCGAALSGTVSSAVLDCGSCATPLSVLVPDAPPRQAVLARIDANRARGVAQEFWSRPLIPAAFSSKPEDTVHTLFAAFYEVERTVEASPELIETIEAVPAADLPQMPLGRMDLGVLGDPAARVPFDPVALQRQGLVFDPSRRIEEALPHAPGRRLLEERVVVVYMPLFVVRRTFGRNLYEVVVDGSTGVCLQARAPIERTARLKEAIAILYVFALLLGMPISVWYFYFDLLSHLDNAAFPIAIATFAGLAWLVGWSWDRIRFRCELVADGAPARFVAINRPERTLPEKVRDGILWVAVKIADFS